MVGVSACLSLIGWRRGGRLFEAGRLLTFLPLGWALSMVIFVCCFRDPRGLLSRERDMFRRQTFEV